MARPHKYDWKAIETAYKKGLTIHEIVKSYKVAKKTLENKISEKKWIVTGELNSHVDEFKESLGKISQNIKEDPRMHQVLEDRLDTIIEDNEIIGNNRKLAKAFQSLMGAGIRDKIYKTPQDIKAGASTLKDLESIANPQASKMEVNNTNTQQTINEIVISEA